MKKIPLEYLSAYLPYKVKAKFKEAENRRCKTFVTGTVDSVYNDSTITCFGTVNAAPSKFKLLLRPLSDFKPAMLVFTEFVPEQKKYILMFCEGLFNIDVLDYESIKFLLKGHWDIFGLINRGLAEAK